jgi:hypothetical protein
MVCRELEPVLVARMTLGFGKEIAVACPAAQTFCALRENVVGVCLWQEEE